MVRVVIRRVRLRRGLSAVSTIGTWITLIMLGLDTCRIICMSSREEEEEGGKEGVTQTFRRSGDGT